MTNGQVIIKPKMSIDDYVRGLRSSWNVGTMESWDNVFWPPARRACGSERIRQCWINGPAVGGIEDIIKIAIIFLKTNIPSLHYSIFGANSEAPKNLYILSRL